nr:hypothetical protein VIGAN_06176900 [Ipomoea batatas]GMD33620.1 hypothetical protein VIGAN_06176900 [Ipomoea batatas]GMD35352.1 hypothetical protein VIGAN_06176900 [Ipomoea batatas]GME18510.1 hypothetical protein VIGAN_06176900 [Ipomoea batatas]
MRMDLSKLQITCHLYGMIMAGTRSQTLYMLTNLLELASVTALTAVIFATMKMVLAMTCMSFCRLSLLSIPSMLRMTSTSLENHMLGTIYLLLLQESTRETRLMKEFT